MLFPNDREALRRMYLEAWQRHRDGLPLEPLQARIADLVEAHPEYQPLIESGEDSLHRDWTPEGGETNPFLHLGMHLAIREQVATDRPAGIAAVSASASRGRSAGSGCASPSRVTCISRPPG